MARKKKRVGGQFGAFISVISTTLVLILLGADVFFVTVASNFSKNLRENFAVEVLLEDNIPQHDLYLLQEDLKRQPYTLRTNYISKEQGAANMNEALETTEDEFGGASPVSAEFELFLKADYAQRDSLERYLPMIKNKPFVKNVIYPQETMDSLNAVIPIVSLVLLIVALLLTLVSFALINNTVRMSVYAKRLYIHSLKLVGAKWSFIRRPFLWQAFCIGLTAAILASALLGAGMYVLIDMNLYLSSLVTVEVIALTLGTIFVCGLLVTMVCTFFSMNRFLRMSTDELLLK